MSSENDKQSQLDKFKEAARALGTDTTTRVLKIPSRSWWSRSLHATPKSVNTSASCFHVAHAPGTRIGCLEHFSPMTG